MDKHAFCSSLRDENGYGTPHLPPRDPPSHASVRLRLPKPSHNEASCRTARFTRCCTVPAAPVALTLELRNFISYEEQLGPTLGWTNDTTKYNKNDRNIVKLYPKKTWILEIQHLGCFPSAGLHEPPDAKIRKETKKETKKRTKQNNMLAFFESMLDGPWTIISTGIKWCNAVASCPRAWTWPNFFFSSKFQCLF